MNVIEKPIKDLKPYPNNAKKHTARQIELLMKSIELTKGLKQPIVIDAHGVIVAGHGRYEAAKQLAYKTVPCVYTDDMTEDEIKLYRLLDNRLAESEIDLNVEFEELQGIELDISDFDFDVFSMDDIEEVNAYDKNNDDREYFEKVFAFPIEKKQQIVNYLKKHYDEVVGRIMQEAETDS